MRTLAALFIVLFLLMNATGQDPAEARKRISDHLKQRNYLQAIVQLETFKANSPGVFEANNYDYLLARTAERIGDVSKAAAYYHASAERGSLLREYALWHLSQIARATGNLILERAYLTELSSFYPDSLLKTAAEVRVARSLFESGNAERAAAAFERIIKGIQAKAANGTPTSAAGIQLGRENQLYLARSYLFAGNKQNARSNFTALVNTIRNPAQPDDIALEAVKGLDQLDEGGAGLSDQEHMSRAWIYQFNRNFIDARLHYSAIIHDFPRSPNVGEATYQIGRGYSQMTDFAEAVTWYERLLEQNPEHPSAKDGLLQCASAYARLGKRREAISRYERYIEKHPDDARVDRAYLNNVDIARDLGEEIEAMRRAEVAREVFRGKTGEAQALFVVARMYLARTEWEPALNVLNVLRSLPDLGGSAVPGGTNRDEVAFLRAVCFLQLRRYADGIEELLSIADGRDRYYGGLATERLRSLSNDAAAVPILERKREELAKASSSKEVETRRKALQDLLRLESSKEQRSRYLNELRAVYESSTAYSKVPKYQMLDFGRRELREKPAYIPSKYSHRSIAEELLFLELFDEGAPELEASVQRGSGNPKDLDYTLAVLYDRGSRSYRASSFMEPLWREIQSDFQIELMPRDSIGMLYPAPYADSLLRSAQQRGVDPRFLLAIMRQESRFRPNAKSDAAARGLMQFISDTSERIAGELAFGEFHQDDLYDAPTAILFASQYAGNLFAMFPKQPESVAASYNAGEDNMKRWLGRAKSDLPGVYVPEIAYSQTKEYVYRVMANYRMYQAIYEENLQLKSE